MGGSPSGWRAGTELVSNHPHQGRIGFRAAGGEIVQKRPTGASRVIQTEGSQEGPFEAFDEAGMGIFFGQPLQGGLEELMERFQMGIGFGDAFDLLGKVGRGEEASVGLAETGVGLPQAGFFEVMESVSAGEVPGDLALMKEVEVASEGASGFGGTASEGAKNPMVLG